MDLGEIWGSITQSVGGILTGTSAIGDESSGDALSNLLKRAASDVISNIPEVQQMKEKVIKQSILDSTSKSLNDAWDWMKQNPMIPIAVAVAVVVGGLAVFHER